MKTGSCRLGCNRKPPCEKRQTGRRRARAGRTADAAHGGAADAGVTQSLCLRRVTQRRVGRMRAAAAGRRISDPPVAYG